MKALFTKKAARQIDTVLASIQAHSPPGALNVRRRLMAIINVLSRHPNAGRLTNRGRVRRMTVTPYPYLLFYRADPEAVVILGLRHAARRTLSSG